MPSLLPTPEAQDVKRIGLVKNRLLHIQSGGQGSYFMKLAMVLVRKKSDGLVSGTPELLLVFPEKDWHDLELKLSELAETKTEVMIVGKQETQIKDINGVVRDAIMVESYKVKETDSKEKESVDSKAVSKPSAAAPAVTPYTHPVNNPGPVNPAAVPATTPGGGRYSQSLPKTKNPTP